MGWKPIETRTHNRFKRFADRRIAIHAGLRWDASAMNAARHYLSEDQLRTFDNISVGEGQILCTATVAKAAWLDESHSKRALIDSSVKRFGLFLEQIVQVPLIPRYRVKGRQGVFFVEIESVYANPLAA